jgi:putative acetyltransferase
MNIRLDDLTGSEVRSLLEEHRQNMVRLSPPESVHTLALDELRQPDVTFWTAWSGGALLGCGALKELAPDYGEIKSMRTVAGFRRQGVGRAMLTHIIREARSRSYSRLSLETGSMEAFKPAQLLYESSGFVFCPPFANYVEDPHSVFMTLLL